MEELAGRLEDVPRARAVTAARAAIEARRAVLTSANGGLDEESTVDALEHEARALAAAGERTSLRPVLNATGVIVHTNLGRAPLAAAAIEAAAAVGRGYSTLEFDLERGGRGSRQAHVEGLVRGLTGAEEALVVNNGAAAALLAASALAASSAAAAPLLTT
ncbi:MAG TPA: hypothetical protein VE528_05560, partial [Thermoleophilaceae bacterium]|nr:hypothetical protein [Thermoleophilaceae bacterium]